MTEFARLLKYLKPYRIIFVFSVVLMVATGLLEGGLILLLQPIFDTLSGVQSEGGVFAGLPFGEYLPKTGALGMSLMGGIGMFATGMWQPVIGSWLDGARATALAGGVDAATADLAAGRATLDNLALFPLALIVLFTILIVVMKRQGIQPRH